MTPESDERHVGVPAQRLRVGDCQGTEPEGTQRGPATGASTSVLEDVDAGRRERHAGMPVQRLRQSSEPFDPRVHGDVVPDIEPDDTTLPAESEAAWWRDLLFNPVLISITVFLAASLLLMIVSEVFQFLQAVQSVPRPLQWLGYLFVAVLVAMAAWAAIRLVRCVTALRVTPQIQESDFYEAKHRHFVRTAAKQRAQEGRKILQAIAAEYPLDDLRFQKLLTSCGCTPEACSGLRDDIQELLRTDDLSAQSWLSRFDGRVLSLMDECARTRVHAYALQVGFKTAVMPTSMADMLIVVTNSLLMLKDLCALYNVRTTPMATCSLAGHLFINAFVAARLEGQLSSFAREADTALRGAIPLDATDAASSAGDAVSTTDFAAGAISTVASYAGSVVTSATFAVGRRSAEGLANYILIRRFGDACIRYLRPIQQ